MQRSERTEPFTAVVLGPLFLDVIFGTVDRLPVPGEELWCDHCRFVAGGAANQARALGRMGFKVALCSYLGEDQPGQMVRALLAGEGISADLLQMVPRQSVTAAISVGTDRAMITSGTPEAPALSGPAPDLLMADLRGLGHNRGVVEAWRTQGTIVIGDVGWDDSGTWDPADLAPLDLVDLFTPNEDEARHYTRTASAQSAAAALLGRVPRVVVTQGRDGVTAAEAGGVCSLPAYPAHTVDPTGAGDVFSAALAWAVLRGGTLRQAASAAAVAGAMSTEGFGGEGAPTLADMRARALAASPAGYDLALLAG